MKPVNHQHHPGAGVTSEHVAAFVYSVLALCCVVVFALAVWLAHQCRQDWGVEGPGGGGCGCPGCAVGEDCSSEDEDLEHDWLVSGGDLDREGYGTVGLRIWTVDGREVDYYPYE